MLELKIAAKEVVALSFGGKHGWPLVEFTVDAEKLTALHEGSKSLREESDKYMEERDAARANNAALRQEIESLKAQKRNAPMITMTVPALSIPPLSVEQVQDAIREAVGRRIAPEWSPIETAPKDESPILAYSKEGVRAVVVSWGRMCERWCIEGGDGFTNPTHWMPLPEPPR